MEHADLRARGPLSPLDRTGCGLLWLAAMKTSLRSLPALALLLFALLALPGALHAQLPKIFVASFGNDANDGSRNSPKRNFQAAHDAVAVGGQIVVLDTAGYGKLSITKSLSVTVPPGVNGFVTTSGPTIGIAIAVGGNDVVTLRGLIVEGNSNGAAGIYATSVGTLTIEDCTVRGCGEGIFVKTTTNAQVSLYNTTVRDCTYGMDIENGANNITVVASASGCRLEANTVAVLALTPSDFSGGVVDFTAEGCTVRGNGQGLRGQNPGAVLRASNCTITGNDNGALPTNGGSVISRGNNTLEKNANGNTFAATYGAK